MDHKLQNANISKPHEQHMLCLYVYEIYSDKAIQYQPINNVPKTDTTEETGQYLGCCHLNAQIVIQHEIRYLT